MTRPLHPGSAALPPNVQIQADYSSDGCTGVTYYAETADEYRHGQRKTAKRLGPGVIDITTQTSSSEAVLLMGMRVLVLQRKAPPSTGIVVQDGQCGGAESVRPFWTDLDKPNSPIIAEADPGGPGDPGHPPVTFPFKVLRNDPEVFELTSKDTTCFCTYAVEIDWVVAGKAGKTILNNGGSGFWVGAAPQLPAYKNPLQSANPNALIRAKYQQLFP
ncbi:hypothetical protein GQF42_00805 [Streptomyces broussonetiae]|uniref:Uncharacterized protein n=1 Tax=Streptomyces broussonetiae TaxID=2686304 RepID=A0A6I6MPE9_9ACTN|nr:hypothetical protein [Streptomyces broussonetiae]QHA02093.1 hypothetical protein GQF42_00805 [Streptomyces broussonetiae]